MGSEQIRHEVHHETYFARMRSLKPELRKLYYQDPIVNDAVRLWASGSAERGDAYESAMIALAEQNAELKEQLVRLYSESTGPIIIP